MTAVLSVERGLSVVDIRSQGRSGDSEVEGMGQAWSPARPSGSRGPTVLYASELSEMETTAAPIRPFTASAEKIPSPTERRGDERELPDLTEEAATPSPILLG